MDRIRSELEKFSSSLLASLPNLSSKDNADQTAKPEDDSEDCQQELQGVQQEEQTDIASEEQASRQTQSRLDFEVLNMKAQHQYIQNLQRANMALKSKIKQLEDILVKEEGQFGECADEKEATFEKEKVFYDGPVSVTTQGDLDEKECAATQIQEMELVSIGKIEEVARKEKERQKSQLRQKSLGPYHNRPN